MEMDAAARRRLLKDAWEEDRFRSEVLKRLDAIEERLAALSARGPAPAAPEEQKQEGEVTDDFFLEGIRDILNGGI